GSGIVSSRGESIYSLESPAPNRIGFDLLRIMRTEYRIDDFQASYFVIDDFEQLFAATQPDFSPYYEELRGMSDLTPGTVLPEDTVLHRAQRTADQEGRETGKKNGPCSRTAQV